MEGRGRWPWVLLPSVGTLARSRSARKQPGRSSVCGRGEPFPTSSSPPRPHTARKMASVKLSPALKALIAAPHARGGPVSARSAADIQSTLHRLADSARENGVGKKAWLVLGVRP